MASIDTNAIPLHKEIKKLHSRLKNALHGKSADRIQDCLQSVFGSAVDCRRLTDEIHNTYKSLEWTCPILVGPDNAMFHSGLSVKLNDEKTYDSVTFNDTWIYAVRLPLSLVLSLHDSWKEQLSQVVETLETKNESTLTMFNCWNEEVLLNNIGWCVPDESADVPNISELNVCVAKSLIHTLQTDPDVAKNAWPTVTPWLHAMIALHDGPPKLSSFNVFNNSTSYSSWDDWTAHMQQLFVQQKEHAFALPDNFSLDDSNSSAPG